MDSLTHIAIGACAGEIIAGKQLGKKAILIGAIAQSIPDIDIVASNFLSPAADLLAHRGFTHSLLFMVLLSPMLGYCSGRVFGKYNISFSKWTLIWGIQIAIHLFLDCFNVYGTGLFEPFSHYRVSFNTVFVLDPLFSIWPVIALVVLVMLKSGNKARKKTIVTALTLSTIYLAYSVVVKLYIRRETGKMFQQQHIPTSSIFTTTTLLNNILWYAVGENDSGFYVGYRSLLDKTDTMQLRYVYKNDTLLNGLTRKDDLNYLIRFSQGYYAISRSHDTVLFHDLRFGEIAGRHEANPKFAFYYYLSPGGDNRLLIQRGRIAKWNGDLLKAFIRRIKGI